MPGCSRVIGHISLARWLVISSVVWLVILTGSVQIITQVHAESNRKIDATVQVSVCGNNVAEGGEQCDNTDLSGKSCSSLQYESGILSCTKSCDFDLSKCVPFVNFAGEVLIPAIARTPSPTTQPMLQPVLSATDSTEQTVSAEISEQFKQTEEPLQLASPTDLNSSQGVQSLIPPEQIELRLKSIFELLEIEELTETNQIKQSYLPTLVHNWSQSWRKTTTLARFTTPTEVELQITKCDVNGDGVCTVEDLSILLYYVSAESMEQRP